MPQQPGLWLVSYDIADPRRLARVARFMEKRGMRIQYSVFAALMNTGEIPLLKDELSELIEPREDDIRFYPIARQGKSMVLGASLLPQDLLPHHPAFRQLRLPLGLPDRAPRGKTKVA